MARKPAAKKKPTKGKRGEQNVSREAVLRAAIENTSHGIVVYGRNLEILAWNETWAEMLGFSKRFLARARTMEDIIREEFRRGFDVGRFPIVEEKIESWLKKAKGARKPYSFEQTLPDGRRVEIRTRPVKGLGLVRTVEDITERKVRERALEVSEQRLLLATTAMGACVWEVNRDTGERYWAPETGRILGYGPRWQPPDGDGWYDLLHPDDVAMVRGHLRNYESGQTELYNAEFRMKHKKGHYIWVNAVGQFSVDPRRGRMFTGYLVDITEIREAQEELRRSQERYALAVAGADQGLWDWDPATQTVFVSPRFRDMMGLGGKSGRITPEDWHSRMHPDDVDKHLEAVGRHVSGNEDTFTSEYRVLRNDGTYRWVQVNGLGQRDKSGWVYRMAGSITDITARKEAEAALQETTQRYALAFEGANEGLWDWSDETGLFHVSPKLRAMMGFADNLQEVKGKHFLEAMHPEDRDAYRKAILDHFKGKTESYETEFRVGDGEGGWRWLVAHGKGIRGEDGRLKRMTGSISDYTERKEAEEELARQKEILQATLDNASYGIIMFDADTRLASWNRRYEEMLEAGPEILQVGRAHDEVVSAYVNRGDMARDAKNTMLRQLWASVRAGEVSYLELEWRNGKILDRVCTPLPDGGAVMTYADITERRRSEEEIARQKEILEATLNNASDGIIMMDADTRIVAWNRRYEDLFEVQSGELEVGRTHAEVVNDFLRRGGISTYSAEEVLPALWDSVRRGEVSQAELDWTDGKIFDRVCTPLPDGGAVMTYADITSRKVSEAALRQSEEQFRTLVENVPGITFRSLFNDDWDLLFIGGHIEEITGYPATEFFGDPPMRTWKELVPEEDWPIVDAAVDPAMAERRQYEMEYRIRHRDGSVRWLNDRGAGVYAGDGSVRWIDSVAFDVTAMKEAEEQLRFAKEAAEKAFADLKQTQARLLHSQKMASLGQLTAGIAHEIKNPLNFINNFSDTSVELLGELGEAIAPAAKGLEADARSEIDDIFATLRGDLETIGKHGQRADGIVRSMLLHSRGTSDDRRMINLNELVEEALDLAWHGERARDKSFNFGNVTIERVLGEDVGKIEAVPQEITRVLLNLFANAFYAIRQRARTGGPRYRPSVTVATSRDGANVVLNIRDNGIGMRAEVRENLFTPFFTTKPAGEGTGLGLSLCHDIIVQQHGGTISVDTEKGSHTKFTISLPYMPSGAE